MTKEKGEKVLTDDAFSDLNFRAMKIKTDTTNMTSEHYRAAFWFLIGWLDAEFDVSKEGKIRARLEEAINEAVEHSKKIVK